MHFGEREALSLRAKSDEPPEREAAVEGVGFPLDGDLDRFPIGREDPAEDPHGSGLWAPILNPTQYPCNLGRCDV